jgi:probable HAF family extracellular repeat protein
MPNSPNSLQQRRLRLRRAGLAAAVALATAGGALAGAETVSAASSDAAAAAARSAPSRVLTVKARDLGAPKDAYWSHAEAVNDRGQVIGTNVFRNEPRVERPFLWERGKMRDLGYFKGRSAVAVDINNAGQVLVHTNPFVWDQPDRAFVWDHGRKTDIGTLGGDTRGVMINDRGQVLAVSDDEAGEEHPVLWYRGALRDLGMPPGSSFVDVTDLNERGDVVGVVWIQGSGAQYVWWPRGRTDPVLLGVPLGSWPKLNDRGQIVLTIRGSESGENNHAAIWWAGKVRSVSPVSATGVDINDSGLVVGLIPGTRDHPVDQAMTWRGGRVTALPTPAGWDTAFAQLVNNRGQVVGGADTLQYDKAQQLVWQRGQIFLLAPLRGLPSTRTPDINEHGQIPGTSFREDAAGLPRGRAVLWTVTLRR